MSTRIAETDDLRIPHALRIAVFIDAEFVRLDAECDVFIARPVAVLLQATTNNTVLIGLE